MTTSRKAELREGAVLPEVRSATFGLSFVLASRHCLSFRRGTRPTSGAGQARLRALATNAGR